MVKFDILRNLMKAVMYLQEFKQLDVKRFILDFECHAPKVIDFPSITDFLIRGNQCTETYVCKWSTDEG